MKNLKISALFDLRHTLAEEYLARFCYLWEALPCIKDFIGSLQSRLETSAYTDCGNRVFIAKSAAVPKIAYR